MSFGDPKGPFPDFVRPQLSEEDVRKVLAMILRVSVGVPIILLLAVGVSTSFYTVQAEERGVIRRFGNFTGIADPGLHFKLPFGIDTVDIVATERVLKQEFGFRTTTVAERTQYTTQGLEDESLMLTGDLNIIDVSWVVQYRISDPEKYLFNVREPERTLRDVSEAVMRRIVGNRIGSDVLTVGRVAVSTGARKEIQEIMDTYDSGLIINTVELQDVVPRPGSARV